MRNNNDHLVDFQYGLSGAHSICISTIFRTHVSQKSNEFRKKQTNSDSVLATQKKKQISTDISRRTDTLSSVRGNCERYLISSTIQRQQLIFKSCSLNYDPRDCAANSSSLVSIG